MQFAPVTLTRRSLFGLAGAGAASYALSGCSSQGSTGTSPDGPLQFWSNHPGSSKEYEQALIDLWNAANPDTPAELIDGGANYEELAQKFNAALAGGQLPDAIVASDVTWFNFALNEALAPLDELWDEVGVDPDSFVDTLREDYNFDGKHFAMPYSRSTALMYFSTDLLTAAGLPTDRGPATWAEFAEWAPKLMEASGGLPALTVPDGSNYLEWYFQGMIWTFGGAYSDKWTPTCSKAESIEAGEFLAEQVKLGHISITKDASNNFSIGKSAGLLQSTGTLGGLNKSATFTFISTYLPGPKPGCPTGGAGIGIPAGLSRERQLTAVRFVDFLTNTANTVTFSQATGYMPVRKAALEDEAEKAYLEANPNAMVAINQLNENTAPQDYARVFVPGGGLRIGGALDKITIGGQDVTEVFTALDEETQTVIDRDITPLLG